MAKPEDRLQARIVKAVMKEYPGSWAFHPVGNPYQLSGVPDLLMCVRGLLVGAEIKCRRPGESEAAARERSTTGQRLQIKLINQAGGIAGVVLSVEDTLDLIERGLKHRTWKTGENHGNSSEDQ